MSASASPDNNSGTRKARISLKDVLLLFCLTYFLFSTLVPTHRYFETSQWKDSFTVHQSSLEPKQTHDLVATNGTSMPLLNLMAPSFFSMDAETGLIDLPAEIDTVIIDIGARESDYMRLVEQRVKNEVQNIALILVDPLPDSIVPLQKRVAAYTATNLNRWLDTKYSNRVFAINGAMAEEEGKMMFNVGSGPACSSLLRNAKDNKFWCVSPKKQMPVLVYTLYDLLALIPKRSAISSMHLKVDAEGADLIVLKGAYGSITRFDTVIIECQPSEVQNAHHEGECRYNDAVDYMSSVGFDGAAAEEQGGYVNAYFWKNKKSVVPGFLQDRAITHWKVYQEIENAAKG